MFTAMIILSNSVVQNYFIQYGYFALFLVFILEGAMLLYFAPSETLVPLAIIFLANSVEEYALVILVAVAGATIGQYVLFITAKRVGRERLLEKKWFRLKDSQLAKFDGWFNRWGAIVVPVSNALFFTRGMLTIPAGLSKMENKKFIFLSALGTFIFETILAALAWYFGPQILELLDIGISIFLKI